MAEKKNWRKRRRGLAKSQGDVLKVYSYRGKKGEKVPSGLRKLIVSEGVQELPDGLCRGSSLRELTLPSHGLVKIGNMAFNECISLLEIKIGSSVRFIGREAFYKCEKLAKVDFEFSESSPHQLQTISDGAFWLCRDLQRIKLPSSVTTVGSYAFSTCYCLKEVNLAATGLTKIFAGAFEGCNCLETVSLPKTLEEICDWAFYQCRSLVTVIVPLDTHSIKIGERSFFDCGLLTTIMLPEDSRAEEDSFALTIHEDPLFTETSRLHECYGEDVDCIVDGLMNRFENLSIHKMCYDHSGISVQELRQCIQDQKQVESSVVDKLGMNPFHIFYTTIEPSIELLEVLLDSLPNQILQSKDAYGMRPLDYLVRNWTENALRLAERTLQKTMIDRLADWGATSWGEAIESKVKAMLVTDEMSIDIEGLCEEVYTAMEHYENVEATSILEMALWKWRLKSGWNGTKRQALDREGSRCLSGVGVVIPTILTFLLPSPANIDTDDEDSADEDMVSLPEDFL